MAGFIMRKYTWIFKRLGMKRKNPITSTEAWHSIKDTPVLSDHHNKIIAALDELKEGIYERIALHIGWDDKNRASRRLAELERKGIVRKTGETKNTSSGRKAFVYQLTPQPKKEVVYQAMQSRLF